MWPRSIRLAHWSLVASTAAAWFTRHTSGPWHEWLGYMALTIVLWRIVYGVVGPHPLRFSDFVVGPQRALDDAKALRQRLGPGAQSRTTHTPLGGYMVVALIVLLLLVSFSGWLYTTDRFWGIAWVGDTHVLLSDLLLLGIALHVTGVLVASRHERVNLIAAMLLGHRNKG